MHNKIIDYLYILRYNVDCSAMFDILEKHKNLIEENIKNNEKKEDVLKKVNKLMEYHNNSIEKLSRELDENYRKLKL